MEIYEATSLIVTWVTLSNTSASVVEYGVNGLDFRTTGTMDVFIDGGSEKRHLYMHRVTLQQLKPGKTYFYHCGSNEGWSDIFTFTTMPNGTNWSPRFAIFGDMGNVNAQSLARLQEETQKGHFDAILHVGDFAYNMDTDNARVGDEFMRQVESVAAYLPYMTCPGNHESQYNFSNYKSRFSMPGGDGQGIFYSYNVGPVHIVSFSSELYYFIQYGWQQLVNQYEWLKKDLEEANKPENRAKRPWIITMCHRPMYCSNMDDAEHCSIKDNFIRVGIPIVNKYGIEELLYKYGVDVHLQAHEHSYERFWPVYDMTVCNGSTDQPYVNPQAPVHIVTGSAGCQEKTDPFYNKRYPWSAFHSDDYGYTRMKVHNRTHLYMEQVSDDKGGKVIDNMWLVKERHDTYKCDLWNRTPLGRGL